MHVLIILLKIRSDLEFFIYEKVIVVSQIELIFHMSLGKYSPLT